MHWACVLYFLVECKPKSLGRCDHKKPCGYYGWHYKWCYLDKNGGSSTCEEKDCGKCM